MTTETIQEDRNSIRSEKDQDAPLPKTSILYDRNKPDLSIIDPTYLKKERIYLRIGAFATGALALTGIIIQDYQFVFGAGVISLPLAASIMENIQDVGNLSKAEAKEDSHTEKELVIDNME